MAERVAGGVERLGEGERGGAHGVAHGLLGGDDAAEGGAELGGERVRLLLSSAWPRWRRPATPSPCPASSPSAPRSAAAPAPPCRRRRRRRRALFELVYECAAECTVRRADVFVAMGARQLAPR